MLTPSAELLNLIVVFQPLFTQPTWENARALLLGALLQRGKRTVTACLRVVGLGQDARFQNYHRALNRAKWSTLQAAKILFGLILIFVPAGGVIVLGADDTIERRRGKQITQVGCYRDPVRSSKKHVIRCFGLKWLALMLLVRLPFSRRVWGLPFLTVLCPTQQEGQPPKVCRSRVRRQTSSGRLKKVRVRKDVATGARPRQHKTAVDILMILMRLVARWTPERMKVLVVDGGFAALKLALVCASLKNTALVMRFHWDAALHHFPAAKPSGRRGPAPSKGPRQLSPKEWAARGDTQWEAGDILWYGGEPQADVDLHADGALVHAGLPAGGDSVRHHP